MKKPYLYRTIVEPKAYPRPGAMPPRNRAAWRHCPNSDGDLAAIGEDATRGSNSAIKHKTSVVDFDHNIRKRRERRNLPQGALAERAELDSTFINDIHRGAPDARLMSLLRTARGLGTTVSDLNKGLDQ